MKFMFGRLCLALAAITIAMPGLAHHSVYGRFDVSKLQKIRGEFDSAELINPHSWFHFYEVDAGGARVLRDGKPVQWSFETPGPAALRRLGITNKLFKPGDVYTIYASPQLDGMPFGLMDITVFPDGNVLVIGNTQDARYAPVLKELGKAP